MNLATPQIRDMQVWLPAKGCDWAPWLPEVEKELIFFPKGQLRNPLSPPSTAQVYAFALGSSAGALQARARFNLEFLGVGGTVEAEVKRLRGLDAARGAVQRQG